MAQSLPFPLPGERASPHGHTKQRGRAISSRVIPAPQKPHIGSRPENWNDGRVIISDSEFQFTALPWEPETWSDCTVVSGHVWQKTPVPPRFTVQGCLWICSASGNVTFPLGRVRHFFLETTGIRACYLFSQLTRHNRKKTTVGK